MYLIFAILGVCGGLCTAAGDILLDLKGKGNQKLGTSKNIDSNWLKMSEWRFRLSVICGMIGCPMGGQNVLVNDPTRGYGIFIENMLEAANQVAEEQALKDAS